MDQLMMRAYNKPKTMIILISCTCGPMGTKHKAARAPDPSPAFWGTSLFPPQKKTEGLFSGNDKTQGL